MVYSVQYARPSILGAAEWRTHNDEPSLEGFEARLYDLGFDLASLLCDVESGSLNKCVVYFEEMRNLRTRFERWLDAMRQSLPEPIQQDGAYLNELSSFDAYGQGSAARKTICVAVIVLKVSYYALLLVLDLAALELFGAIEKTSVSGAGTSIRPEQITISLFDQDTTLTGCFSTTEMTLRMIALLTQDSMGWYGAQKALFPLYMVQYYLTSYPSDLQQEASRMQQQLKETKGIGHAQAIVNEWTGDCM